jgi:methylisocitrate lyase
LRRYDMTSLRSGLKARLDRGETIVAPGAYDPISARIVQYLGFPAAYTGGYMSGAHLAVSEPLMTMTEQVEVARKVASAVDIPVICDAGAGYGDPVHTMRTVRVYEDAGLGGLHIEDQVYPKRASYHMGLEHITPVDEFLQKMQYALQARRDEDFLIIGRTDAFSAVEGSMEEAVRRGRALRDLGVDVIMPRGVREKEDLAHFRGEVPDVPLLVIAGADDISVKEYQDLGYQIVIYAVTSIVVAATAIQDAYRNLRDTGLTGVNAQDMAERRARVEELISLPEYYQVEAQTTEREYQDRAGGR